MVIYLLNRLSPPLKLNPLVVQFAIIKLRFRDWGCLRQVTGRFHRYFDLGAIYRNLIGYCPRK